MPQCQTTVTDVVLWIKHLDDARMRSDLESLASEQELTLQVDEITGRWCRMKTGSDGRPTLGLRPVGPMRDIWMRWFTEEKGKVVTVRPVNGSDDLTNAATALMVEWSSPEDNRAFAGL